MKNKISDSDLLMFALNKMHITKEQLKQEYEYHQTKNVSLGGNSSQNYAGQGHMSYECQCCACKCMFVRDSGSCAEICQHCATKIMPGNKPTPEINNSHIKE